MPNPSSVYFIKGSGVCETAVPDFVNDPFSMILVFAIWSTHHREYCTPSHTLLMLLRNLELASREKLSRPPTLAAER